MNIWGAGPPARPGPSAFDAVDHLSNLLGQARRTLRREQLPSDQLVMLYRQTQVVGIYWIWEIQSYQQACRDIARRRGERINFRALRNSSSLIATIYPSASTDDNPIHATAESAAAHGILTNRFVAFLLENVDGLFRNAVPPAEIAEQLRSAHALVRALDLLARTIRTFLALAVQPIEDLAQRPRRIFARMNRVVHSRDFFEVSRQTFFRELPANVFYDYEPHSAIVSFRTALERKLREALAVLSFQLDRRRIPWHRRARSRARKWLTAIRKTVANPKRLCRRQAAVASGIADDIKIISVGAILDAWNELGLRVLAPGLSVGQLRRLYRWSNQVVHGARRCTLPEIWFALDVTTELFRGTTIGNEWTNATIVTAVPAEEQARVLRQQMGLGPEWQPLVYVVVERSIEASD